MRNLPCFSRRSFIREAGVLALLKKGMLRASTVEFPRKSITPPKRANVPCKCVSRIKMQELVTIYLSTKGKKEMLVKVQWDVRSVGRMRSVDT